MKNVIEYDILEYEEHQKLGQRSRGLDDALKEITGGTIFDSLVGPNSGHPHINS